MWQHPPAIMRQQERKSERKEPTKSSEKNKSERINFILCPPGYGKPKKINKIKEKKDH